MTIFGPDISSFQGYPDFAAVKAAGNDFVVIKVTEGLALHRRMQARGLTRRPDVKAVEPTVTLDGKKHKLPVRYVNPSWSTNRQRAHSAGLIVLFYHFARGNNPAAEAAYFLQAIGGLQPGEGLVLDWEIPGDAANWSKAFLDAVVQQSGIQGFVYENQSAINGFNWSAVAAAGYRLWAAIYDGDPWTQPPAPYWGAAAMKQYTDAASIPGISGSCDRNAYYGTREQLLASGSGGVPDMEIGELYAWRDDHGRNLIDFANFTTGVLDSFLVILKDLQSRVADVEAKQAAGGSGLDPAAITAAVNAGVAAALKNIHVVTGP